MQIDKKKELLKTNNNKSKNIKTKKYDEKYDECYSFVEEKRQAINNICEMLNYSTSEFDEESMVEAIRKCNEIDKLDRILYSEISAYMFKNEIDEGIFASNLDRLLLHVLNKDKNIANDERRCAIKIYDHCQLALQQKTYVGQRFQNELDSVKDKIKNEIKNGIEKEYISILGIFAAIVMAFTGGLAFSTSVLQFMDTASIYRIVLVVDMLAVVLLAVINMLVGFIAKINNQKEIHGIEMKTVFQIAIVVAIITSLLWVIDLGSLKEFLHNKFSNI